MLKLALATALGTGFAPVAPGTWASLLAVVLAWTIHFAASQIAWLLIVGVFVLSLVGGVPLAGWAAREVGEPDPSLVVIDEVAGQLLCLLLVPFTPLALVSGFLLFRLFDILKPFPIRHLEKLPGGWGIMLDDLAAGLYAAGGVWLLVLVTAVVSPTVS